MIASVAADLRRYPASAAAYLQDGLPPNVERPPAAGKARGHPGLAAQGSRDFYEGDLARSIAADVQAGGGALSIEDLASFPAHLREPLAIPYRGGTVYATPELTCGPTLAHALGLLQESLWPGRGGPDAKAYMAYVLGLQSAYRERLQDMGDADGRRALSAEHLAPACITHFSVVDRSTFGSKYVLQQSGVP